MKKIHLVAATPLETTRLRDALRLESQGQGVWAGRHREATVTLFHTGIGAVNTAWTLAGAWSQALPDLAIHFGIAGSFSREIPLGTVVELIEDDFADLGAASPQGFIDLEAMGFPLFEKEGKPCYNALFQPNPSSWGLPQVAGITVNTVTGTSSGVSERMALGATVETMESAAFFYACLRSTVDFISLRSISNYVEVRNVKAWDIPLAVNSVQQLLLAKLDNIC